MKPRTLLLLALVVGALAAAVFLFERDLPSTDERAAKSKRVVPVESDDLVALEIEWAGKKARFERDPKPEKPAADGAEAPPARAWRMLEPFAARADDAALSAFLGQLTALEVERELAGAVRGDVGLEPPRGQLRWRTPEENGTLEIGGKIPAAAETVVAASGRAAPAVVADAFVAQLEREPGEWRSREVVTAARSDIERITLRAAGGAPVVLAKSGETLRLESPVDDVADREAVDQLLADLTALRVETFLDPPLTENTTAALAAPAGTIEIVVEGGDAPLTLELGGGEPLPGKRIARAGGQAFVAATPLLDSISRPAPAWRSRHWTRFENWRVERVTIDDAVGKVVVERKDGKWLRDGVEIPFSAASDLLYAISSAKAAETREESLPTEKPALTLTLADADGNQEVLTLHGDAVAGTRVARVSGRDLSLLLPEATAGEISSKVGALRAAEPVVSPAPAATPSASEGGNATPSDPS